MEERKTAFFLILDAGDPYHAALGPFSRSQTACAQLLDPINDQLENPAVPARGRPLRAIRSRVCHLRPSISHGVWTPRE